MNGYTVEIDNISRVDWSKILLQFDDANLYQTWEYGAAKWGEKNLVHLILKKSGEISAAAQIWYREVPVLGGGFAHVSMGPLWRIRGKGINFDNIQNMVRALHQEFVIHRGVLLRIYTYEKENDEGNSIRQIFEAENLKRTNEPQDVTILLNISPDIDIPRKNLRKSWRRQLNKVEKNNLSIISGADDKIFNVLCNIYEEMLSRKGFTEHIADIKQLAEVQKRLPADLKMRIFICQRNGDFIGGQAVSALGNTAIDIIAAISNNDISQKLKSTYLFEWMTIKHMKENGFKFLDLRGYDPERYPGPSYYKAGLGGDIVKYLGIFECSDNLLSSIIVHTGKFVRIIKNLLSKSRNIIPVFY